MLEIKEISIRNFLSYGDYDTTVSLDSLGPCLVVGEVCDGEELNNSKDSNGSGKSNLVNAILWCLFGRTMHNSNPGDKVINYFTKRDCSVKITLKNGDQLIRTRKVDGCNDLLLIRDGQDISLGTTKMQQATLNKELNLDWDIFCGSTFFSQFGKSWMEMSDSKRKEALEREFHMDRILLYAEVSKEKKKKVEEQQNILRTEINGKRLAITNFTSEIKELQEASNNFETEKTKKLNAAADTLKRLVDSRDSMKMYDIDAVKSKWSAVDKILAKLKEHQSEIHSLESRLRAMKNDVAYNKSLIKKWEDKGELCKECEQPITSDHVDGKTTGPREKIAKLESDIKNLASTIKQRQEKFDEIRQYVDNKKPSMTVGQATNNNTELLKRDKSVEQQIEFINGIKKEENRYQTSIDRLQSRIEEIQKETDKLLGDIKKLDIALLHYNYIYRAYSDRRKIKSHMLQEYIPYLNERINHYLSRFVMDLKIEFTNALAVKSNYWSYDFFSGGERKRIDVAIMIAMFDLHTVMYGRQCNIIAFDEVDGRLDVRGAEAFVDIVKNDLACKTDTVLVISQRNDIKGVFPSEIKIKREDRFSTISEITV